MKKINHTHLISNHFTSIPTLKKDVKHLVTPHSIKTNIKNYNTDEWIISLFRVIDNAIIFKMSFRIINTHTLVLDRLKVYINKYRNLGIATYYYCLLNELCVKLYIENIEIEMLAELPLDCSSDKILNQTQLEQFYKKNILSGIRLKKRTFDID